MIIAIDGPAGSGKTTTAYQLAKKIGFSYLDTGATYRLLTLKALREKVDLENFQEIKTLAEGLDIRMEANKIYLDKEDVTDEIRTPLIDKAISKIAVNPLAREVLVEIQRKIAQGKNCVVEGRDTTTVVFPDAEFKFYLDAHPDTRVKRRYLELQQRGITISLDDVDHNLKKRDHADTSRKTGPLKKSAGAICVDTTSLTIEETVEKLLSYMQGSVEVNG